LIQGRCGNRTGLRADFRGHRGRINCARSRAL